MVNADVNRIRFFYLDQPFYFPSRTRLKKYLLSLFSKEGYKVDAVNYIFCSDEYLLELNKTHLNHNTFTDIITFQFSGQGQPVLSDIYISIPRVRENAQTFETSFLSELHRVLFHGALHLCGYGDKTKEEALIMRSKEESYLERVPRGTR